ncbi:MAG: hypothetical protein GIW94_09475 [Candidatus Eremiobacteraeota bacterium]|nr:hypothetical protein [Candidatus Eremiobacteraeota bacterium]
MAARDLADSVAELSTFVDKHMPTFAPMWQNNARAARAFADVAHPMRDDALAVAQMVRGAFGSGRDGTFLDAGPWSDDEAERFALNEEFERKKDSVWAAVASLEHAANEGEVNTLAVRRHLTTLETVLIETRHQAEAERARKLLDADEVDCMAAVQFASELEARTWTGATTGRVPAIVGALKAELAPYVAAASP